MKAIILTKGKIAGVDDDDFEELSKFRWCAQKRKNGFHVARYSGKKYIYMHRHLMGMPPGVGVDHIDGDGLNNARLNLRVASKSQNGMGFRKLKGKSGFRGVSLFKQTGQWSAQLQKDGVKFWGGLFSSKVEAALAYDRLAVHHFGEFAQRNFV